jgi:hypothetical protein
MATIELLTTVSGGEDGLEALIMDGNDKHNYRTVLRDIDANETVSVIFTHTYYKAMQHAKSFVFGIPAKS